MKKITIATRGSKLALWQAEHIRSLLERKYGCSVELLVVKTQGDIILDVPLAKVGGKGLFVKEIEEALLDGRADLAVHSMKDVPMELPAGLSLPVITERVNPADLLLSMRFPTLEDLPSGAVVGTSSLRRQAQLLQLRPDLVVRFLRGNVDTRLRKLAEGQYDAIIMAAAGMARLQLSVPYMQELPVKQFIPAVGQGALGIEICAVREDLSTMLAFLSHQETYDCVIAERAFLAGLEGGCQVPIGGYATIDPGDATQLTLEGLVASIDGKTVIRKRISGSRKDALKLGAKLAGHIKEAGGGLILQEYYKEH